MSRGILSRGDIVRGDIVRGDIVPGDVVRGDIVRGDIVRGDIFLIPRRNPIIYKKFPTEIFNDCIHCSCSVVVLQAPRSS